MHCPFCSQTDTRVIDSRLVANGGQVRRRRECASCHERFTTFEAAELLMPKIIKQDGKREPFDEEKLRNGFARALEKRPVSVESIESALNSVRHYLQALGEREVTSMVIGERVMEELQLLDQVAYVRFASVYRSFQDISEFQQEIARLQSEPHKSPVTPNPALSSTANQAETTNTVDADVTVDGDTTKNTTQN